MPAKRLPEKPLRYEDISAVYCRVCREYIPVADVDGHRRAHATDTMPPSFRLEKP